MSTKSDVEGLEERLRELRTVLSRLESGRLITREWVCGETWRQTTQRDIERHKREIAKYEGILAQVRASHAA